MQYIKCGDGRQFHSSSCSPSTSDNKATGTMQLEILSRETIKPSSPNPPARNIHHLCLFDQLTPHMYVPLVLFYPKDVSTESKARLLKKSLADSLVRYYPFAGRLKDKVSVECHDEGVTFLEARVGCKISEILENPRREVVDQLFVDGLPWKKPELSGPLLTVQITTFDCGGTAVGVCLSHKVADASTMVTFVNHWASTSRKSAGGGEEEEGESPEFKAAIYFPLGELPPPPERAVEEGSFVCKRFVFEASKIKALKTMIGIEAESPTRVEAVTALLYKSAISASRSSSGSLSPTALLQTINLRSVVVPPLPETSAGNIVGFFPVITGEETEIGIQNLVAEMKKGKADFCNNYAKKYRSEEWFSLVKRRFEDSRKLFGKPNQVVYKCSSWCRFPIYEADFGWGKPVWVTMADFEMGNSMIMTDTRDGHGIEAVISLEEKEMALFERDEELLSFASSKSPLNDGL